MATRVSPAATASMITRRTIRPVLVVGGASIGLHVARAVSAAASWRAPLSDRPTSSRTTRRKKGSAGTRPVPMTLPTGA